MRKIYPLFTAIILIYALLITAAYLVLYVDSGLYAREFSQNSAAEKSGMALNEILNIQKQLMLFLRGGTINLSQITARMDGQVVPFFNTKVIQHMEDVRHIFLIALKSSAVGFLYILSQVFYLRRLQPQEQILYLRRTKRTGYIVLGIFSSITLLSALFFSRAFVIFHKIFFQNDLWIFDARTDFIIRWLPESFFQHVAAEILLVFIIMLSLIYAAGKIYIRHLRTKDL